MRTNGFFWRALERARQANLEASGAQRAVSGPFGISRRRLLGAMAAGAALPAVGCKPLPAAEAGTRVAVIGGGLAGLIALRDLRAAGMEAHLYEGRSRLGGRVSTYRGGPVPADDGGQFINGDHADMLALARQYGLELIDRAELSGVSMAIADGRVIGEDELASDLRTIAARIAADAEALDADYDAAAPAFDAISVSQYLDRHQDALEPYVRAVLDGGARPYIRDLLEATIRTEFGQEPEDASALEFIFNLPVVDGRHVRVIGSSDERFVLQGGSGRLIEALAPEAMPHVSLGHVLERIEKAGDGVRLHFMNGVVVEAERAIITVPAPLLRTIEFGELLPENWRRYVTEIDCGRNEKLNAAYRGRPWDRSMGLAGDVWPLSGDFAEAWDATTVEGDTGLMTFFMGGRQCQSADGRSAGDLRQAFETQAQPAVRGLGDASALWQRRTHWTKDRFARGAYSCFRPGQLTRFAELFWLEEEGKVLQAPVAGPLIFAGEHLSDAWPGYMNGGAQTGRLAAQVVLQGVAAGGSEAGEEAGPGAIATPQLVPAGGE